MTCVQARDECDADEGAEMGIAPWKFGNLAACILMWDIVWVTTNEEYREDRELCDDYLTGTAVHI